MFAAATGRILVLPPDQPMYLLDRGKGHQKAHSFADFFPFDYIGKRLQVITMEEFMAREAITGIIILHYHYYHYYHCIIIIIITNDDYRTFKKTIW